MLRPSIKYERKVRGLHRWIGLSGLLFLLVSVISGLLWANSKFLYWDNHYKEKVRSLPGPPLESAKLSLDDVIRLGSAALVHPAVLEQISLRSEVGRLIYDLRIRTDTSSKVLLIDANTGEWLSPISVDTAIQIADQYVQDRATPTSVAIEQYTPRKKHHAVDAIRVSFNDKNETHIILDRQSGEILEDEGRWRRFHFFVMQLHQLNFLGFEKTLLNIPGFPLLLMGLTGLALWVFQISRNNKPKLEDSSTLTLSHGEAIGTYPHEPRVSAEMSPRRMHAPEKDSPLRRNDWKGFM